jgi:IS66 C-terminal element
MYFGVVGPKRATRLSAHNRPVKRTCKQHEIDRFAYLRDIPHRLPSHPAEQLHELLPDVWFASQPSARRKRAA